MDILGFNKGNVPGLKTLPKTSTASVLSLLVKALYRKLYYVFVLDS